MTARSLSRGKELILINKGDEIEFLIDNMDDGRVWIIKPEYHVKKGIMVLEKRNGYIIRLIEKDLRKLGIRNMNELIKLIRTRPSETIESLIGEKVKISKVITKDLSNSNAKD
jgi:Mg/Co/Ni transporter MgtE